VQHVGTWVEGDQAKTFDFTVLTPDRTKKDLTGASAPTIKPRKSGEASLLTDIIGTIDPDQAGVGRGLIHFPSLAQSIGTKRSQRYEGRIRIVLVGGVVAWLEPFSWAVEKWP